MSGKRLDLAWISVKDFKKAIKFYTEVVGLKIAEINEEWCWAELIGEKDGFRLGIGGECQPGEEENCPVKPGQNAVITITVPNLEIEMNELQKKGVRFVGKIQEVPGHVKMQLVQDIDGNYLHFVEKLPTHAHTHHRHEHHHEHGGCCKGH